MNKLEGAANTSIEWFLYNGMKLNSKKCHLIVCGNKSECMISNIEKTQVIETRRVKLLGIEIDSELSFVQHMNSMCKRASQKLNALSQLCIFLPFHRRKSLMQAPNFHIVH